MPTLTRRAALGGLALIPAATAAASPKLSVSSTAFSSSGSLQSPVAPAGEPSRITALYARWLELYNVPYTDLADDEENDALSSRMWAIEDELSAVPAQNGRDLALKLLALTHFGAMMIEERHGGIFADARRLAGEVVP